MQQEIILCVYIKTMPNQKSLKMEDMSEAFVRALCAVHGYSIVKCEHDNDGVDIGIRCKGKPCDESDILSPEIEVQLKSSYSKITQQQDGSINYSLEVKNYKSLIEDNRMIPLILVVFHMPTDEGDWIEQTTDWLKIKKCAYWISLKGREDTENQESITINIPADHQLTKDSLRSIMIKISKQEEL